MSIFKGKSRTQPITFRRSSTSSSQKSRYRTISNPFGSMISPSINISFSDYCGLSVKKKLIEQVESVKEERMAKRNKEFFFRKPAKPFVRFTEEKSLNVSSVTIYAKDSKIVSNEVTQRTFVPTQTASRKYHRRANTDCQGTQKSEKWPQFNIKKRSIKLSETEHPRAVGMNDEFYSSQRLKESGLPFGMSQPSPKREMDALKSLHSPIEVRLDNSVKGWQNKQEEEQTER